MPSLLASVAAEAGSDSSESRRLRTGSSATAAAMGSSMTSTANIAMAIEALTIFFVNRFYGFSVTPRQAQEYPQFGYLPRRAFWRGRSRAFQLPIREASWRLWKRQPYR